MEKALDILKLFQSDKYKFESGAPLWKPELDSKMKEAIAELEEAMIVLKELNTQLKAKNEEIKNLKVECECDQRNAAMSQKESVQYLNRIAELEETMKPKTCDGCKWLAIGKYCILPVGCCIRKSNDYFEPKDN